MRNYAPAAVIIAGILLAGHSAKAVVPDSADLRQKVIACFVSGNKPGSKPFTIQLMHDCSGVWVTPRALLQCSFNTDHCPVFSDSLTDRGTFFQTLKNDGIDITSVLSLSSRPDDLPPMPTAAAIGTCKDAVKNDAQFQDCVLSTMVPQKYKPLLTCFQQKGDNEKATCFANQVNDHTFTTVVQCLTNKPSAEKLVDKFVECTAATQLAGDVENRRNCVAGAPTPEQALHCLTYAFNVGHSQMTDCLSKASNGAEAVACLDYVNPPASKTARETVACISDPKKSLLSCVELEPSLTGPIKGMVVCLDGAKDYKSQIECASSLNPEFARAQRLTECARSNPSGPPLLGCVAPYLGGDAQKFASCVGVPAANVPNCLGTLNPQLKSASDTLSCISAAKGNDALLGCVATQVGGPAPHIASCLTQSDRTEIAPCLLGNTPEVRAAQSAYNCVAKSSDVVSVVGYCAQVLPIDDKTREALTCVARAGGDRDKLAACVAGAVLPPEASRMVSCAVSSQGVTSFALCAASPAINEEWRIASECAVETGGVVIAFAGCTAGRLTVNELTKCFKKVGGDGGCFGENNTVVKTFTDAYNDLTKGPGPNNDAVKAIKALITIGPNSVINKPEQLKGGPNSLINNPSQIWGGPNSVINNPSQIWGGPNSIVRNPGQLLGGPNSLVNNPSQILGGENSAVRQFIAKPLGGDCSFFHRPAGC